MTAGLNISINKIGGNRKITLFSVILFCFAVFSFVFAIASHGRAVIYYFHQDIFDSFMNLFNSVAKGRFDYHLSNYPAMGDLPYKFLYCLVPNDLWNFDLGNRENAFLLRSSIYGQGLLLLHFAFFIIPYCYLISSYAKKNNFSSVLLILIVICFFDYKLGALEYRSVRFEKKILDTPNFQGNAVVNYTDKETPWTRIIEHKWFEFGKDENGNELAKSVISHEYSSEWKPGDEPYYPVNDEKNNKLYEEYKKLSLVAGVRNKFLFGGRLGDYKYYDMDRTIEEAIELARRDT